MKFLMVSNCGEGAHILRMVQDEGNDCRLYTKDPEYRNVFDGLLPKAKRIDPKPDEVVIFDFSGFGKIAEDLKKSGVPIVGGSGFADKVEQDRMFGLELMEKCDIKIPLTMEFQKSSKGVKQFLDKYAEKEDGSERRFVYKPSGKGLPCFLTYCSIDRADLEEYMVFAEKNFGNKIESFVLQEFVCGVVISSEMWCDGSKFLRPGNHTLEVKGFMDGNLGPATGCSGNILYIDEHKCRIIQSGVAKAEKAFVDAGHVGPVDLNAVVNQDGVFGLEWTPRFGYDATPTQMFLMRGNIGKFFSDVARGQAEHVPMESGYAAAVRLSIPPYPLDPIKPGIVQEARPNVGVPIRGLTDKNIGQFYFYEVMEQDGQLVHSSGTGLVGCAVGIGEDPWCAFDGAYAALREIKIPEKQFRQDLRDQLCMMHCEAECYDGVSLGSLEKSLKLENEEGVAGGIAK